MYRNKSPSSATNTPPDAFWVSLENYRSRREALEAMVATIAPDISKTASNFSSWEDTAILETIRGRLGLARFLLVLHDVPSELPWSQILSETFRFGDSAARRGSILLVTSAPQVAKSCSPQRIFDFGDLPERHREYLVKFFLKRAVSLLATKTTAAAANAEEDDRRREVLRIKRCSSYNLADSYMLSPPRLLQTLSISGSKGLPHWVAGLHQLVKITLRETYLTGDALYVLGNLRSLRCLSFLPKALAEGIIKFSAGEFSNLVHLFFQEDYIISVIFDHETAPRLETVVFDVKIITSLHGIRNLPSLKDLQIKGELRGEQAVQQAIADHPNSPDYESKIQGKDRYRYSPGLFVLCCICC
uniref:Disease resistance R13L4/SHOC-2-like LRR domain-containing protein n=1 Tax=Oryza barthii TaxID=65489 RepID=A0A0D3HPM1_9ORYZ